MSDDAKNKYGPDKRWTKKLAERYTPVSDAFLRYYSTLDPPISPGEALTVIQLISFKWGKGAPFPAVKTLAKRLGMSDGTVRKHLRNLEKNKYLKRRYKTAKPSRYDLRPLFVKLEAHLETKEAKAKKRKKLLEKAEELRD